MADVSAGIQWQGNNQAWFTANAAEVFPANITIFCNEAPNYGQYKYTDGVTALSALDWMGSSNGGTITSVNGDTGPAVVLDKTDIGLSNVDNTSDANKPVSTAQQAALDTKVVSWLHQPSGGYAPADAQYYYFGQPNAAVTNTVGDTSTNLREIGAPVTGTIIAAIITFNLSNFASITNETGSLKFRNTTAGTLTTLSSSITYDSAVQVKNIVVSGLSVAVTQGDKCMSILGNTTWATNPANVTVSILYIIRP